MHKHFQKNKRYSRSKFTSFFLQIRSVLLLSALLLFFSCENSKDHQIIQPVPVDTSISNYNNEDIIESIPYLTQKAGLASISNGVDSFETRIWVPISAHIEKIISIKFVDHKWEITSKSLWLKYPNYEFKRHDTINHFLEVIVDSIKTKILTPKSNVSSIIDTLILFNMQNLPSMKEIEAGQVLDTHPYNYVFEFADKKNYRILVYLCTSREPASNKFDKKISDFLQFISRQLNSDFEMCYQ